MSWDSEALRRREKGAWRQAHRSNADRLYQYAFFRLRASREAALDVTQEVFARAIESIHRFQGDEGGFLGWLFGIARRVIAERIKRTSADRSLSFSLEDKKEQGSKIDVLEVSDKNPLPDQRIILNEEQWLTGAALSALPSHYKKALRWKYCEDLSVIEMAERLGMTPKAVESMLSRARKAFRERFWELEASGRIHSMGVEELSNE